MRQASRKNAPRKDQIVAAQERLITDVCCMSIHDAVRTCWGCGFTATLERCHIVGHANGGSDTDPRNYFLLCRECHRNQPDGGTYNEQIRWLDEGPGLQRGLSFAATLCRTLQADAPSPGLLRDWMSIVNVLGLLKTVRVSSYRMESYRATVLARFRESFRAFCADFQED